MHPEGRLNFARQHIQWSEDWKKVVLTDETRFSLDGPDGFQHYWHDLRKEPMVISRRPQGGGGAMVRDEVHFWLDIYVNKQNCHIWSEKFGYRCQHIAAFGGNMIADLHAGYLPNLASYNCLQLYSPFLKIGIKLSGQRFDAVKEIEA
ncbi:hypothetical protein Trydic_g23537 [Trypoxylus dichotomus]